MGVKIKKHVPFHKYLDFIWLNLAENLDLWYLKGIYILPSTCWDFPPFHEPPANVWFFQPPTDAKLGANNWVQKTFVPSMKHRLVIFYTSWFHGFEKKPYTTGRLLANPRCLPKPTASHPLVVSNPSLGSIPQDAIITTRMTFFICKFRSPQQNLRLPRLASWVGFRFKPINWLSPHWSLSQDGFKGFKKDIGAVSLADLLAVGGFLATLLWKKYKSIFSHLLPKYMVNIKNIFETTWLLFFWGEFVV